MKFFIDAVSGERWAFDDDCDVAIVAGAPVVSKPGVGVVATLGKDVSQVSGAVFNASFPAPPVDALRARAYAERGASTGALIVALWEKIVEGRPQAADALQAIRVQVKAELPQ